MIAGLILNHIGQSQYNVQLSYDITKAQALVSWHEQTRANKQSEQAEKEQILSGLQTENAGLTTIMADSQIEIDGLLLKPAYPGDSYDFKDYALIATLLGQIDGLEFDRLSLSNFLAVLYGDLQAERDKPVAGDGNPECLPEFFCESRETSIISDIESTVDQLNANATELNDKNETLAAEQRKMPSLADAGVGYYQDEARLKELQSTVADSQKKVDENNVNIENIQFFINVIKIEILALNKKIDWVNNHQGEDLTVQAYSNEYDESLTGIVAVELIGGNITLPVIVIGVAIDGLLSKTVNINKEVNYINFALMSGWLKWKQRHGIGLVNSVAATVQSSLYALNNKLSSVKNITPYGVNTINAASEYPYEVNDKPLIKYSASGVPSYLGWYEAPRKFGGLLVLRTPVYTPPIGSVVYKYEAYSSVDMSLVSTGEFIFEALPDYLLWVYSLTNYNLIQTLEVGDKTLSLITQDNTQNTLKFDYVQDGISKTKTVTYSVPVPATVHFDYVTNPLPVLSEGETAIAWNLGLDNWVNLPEYLIVRERVSGLMKFGKFYYLETVAPIYIEYYDRWGGVSQATLDDKGFILVFDENLNLVAQPLDTGSKIFDIRFMGVKNV